MYKLHVYITLFVYRLSFESNLVGGMSAGHYSSISIKVARVVNLKLLFKDLKVCFFSSLIMLIKLCKIRYLNLDKALQSSEKPGHLSEKLKTLTTSSTTVEFNIFC